ncbi:uncharacterized protein LOC129807708 [Phlebotomus papatasi]|uniref:uncharacterized protein LOC129807708 n=1 Tax=Phlebotomus papatasi TaxID=29031 RepID=UPI002484360C|nr:uncharacterized protein LOC129807708 [Phlebotomus papatasi]
MPDKELSRRAYKGQLTSLKKILEKYQNEPALLEKENAEAQLVAHRDMIGRIEKKFQAVQMEIITAAKAPEEREKENEEMLTFLDDCMNTEMAFCELLASIPASKGAASEETIGLATLENPDDKSGGGALGKLIHLMSQQLKEQRQQRLSEESKFKDLMDVQREEISKILNASRIDLNESLNPLNESDLLFTPTTKLEPIKLPTFGGSYCEWPTFKNLFISSVDKNPNLTKAIKMQYLRTNTTGQAFALFESLPISAENYDIAWGRLTKRYDNKMLIVKSHMERFLDQQTITKPSAAALRKLQSSTTQSLEAIDALQVTGRDPWLIHWTLNHLDHQTRTLWSEKKPDTVPTWKDFDEFLDNRCRKLEECPPPQNTSKSKQVSSHVTEKAEKQKRENCKHCNLSPHKLYKCRKFLGLQPKKRLEIIKNLKLCQNCLIDSHDINNCTYQSCKFCNEKHNHLIHDAYANPTSPPTVPPQDIPSNGGTALNCSGRSRGVRSNVLFATARVKLLGNNNTQEYCRAILDPASQVNIISSFMSRKLQLTPSHTNFIVDGVGSISQSTQQETQVHLQVKTSSGLQMHSLDCLVMMKVVGEQPNWEIDVGKIQIPSHFELADPTWFRRQKIDLLIGGSHAWQFLGVDRHILGEGLPMLQHSIFGWLVVGPCYSTEDTVVASCNLTTLASIDRTIKKFWEVEEVPKEFAIQSEHEEVETLFSSTTSQGVDGRYMVMLPLKDQVKELDNNRGLAVRQLNYLDRKLGKNPSLRTEYDAIFREYLELNIIEKVPISEMKNPSYYFPHHCVIKKDSATTKIRIVFNASSRSKTGMSLNDCIMTCPVVQPTLVSILWRFRLHEVALTCDIVKMYLQVLMHPSHRDFHRFVWFESGQVIDYRFRTVCFGVSASPYLATRVLNQIADDNVGEFPQAASMLKWNFYVDDCLFSAPTVDEVISAKKQLEDLLSGAGMQLSKFRTNNIDVLQANKNSTPETEALVLDDEAKTLGILWNPRTDAFHFRVTSPLCRENPTKRYILSTIARIFDPCGLIGPIVTTAKIILQDTWATLVGWDDPISKELVVRWQAFVDDLADVELIQIPRWASTIRNTSHRELHAFCDASKSAYGCSIYLVCEDDICCRSSFLIVSKSRLMPITTKEENPVTLTIPKAELSGAELATQLMSSVSQALSIEHCFYWTDATVVLCQIYSPNRTKDLFVRRRVSKILSLSNAIQWRHVSTLQNPADVLSRGTKIKALSTNNLWWYGPDWLVQQKDNWPSEFNPSTASGGRCETLKALACTTDAEQDRTIHGMLMHYHSSFLRIIRVLCWINRAATIFKTLITRRTRSTAISFSESLQVEELQRAETLMLRWEQEKNLSQIITAVRANRYNSLPNPMRKLNPFLDSGGFLRVGGRLHHSSENFDLRHPIIIPKGKLAELLGSREHHRLLHAGPQLTLASLRRKYWLLNGRNTVKKIIHLCITCIRAKPPKSDQLMGDLPSSRVTSTRPFLHTGIDLTGHIMIKRLPRGAAQEKAYVAIFVCMTIKAVHLELLTSLSTNAFIAAFKRFVSRRGLPAHVYTDNGTNFVGSAKELKRLLKEHQTRKELSDFSSGLHVQWHFNPPGAPHQGGLWEAAVRSFKHHFSRIVGTVSLTYEELNTVVIQIEAVLNSRPLVAITDDPRDPTSLTPGDFLTWGALTQMPVAQGDIERTDRVQRWELCTKLQYDFFKRWKRDYLHTLQQRHRWNKESPNLVPGDVVLLKSDVAPSLEWPIGLVEKVFPGTDQRVRVAQVKINGRSFLRPVTKLVKLPVRDNECS